MTEAGRAATDEPTTDSSAGRTAPDTTGVGPRELIVLVSSIMAVMALGIDLVLPGFDDIRSTFELGEGSSQVGQVITVYFFGLAVSQLVYGPLTDRFGRKPILWLGLGIYCLGAVASAVAPTFATLLGARFVWGIGAAGARVVATSIVRDRFVGESMARVMSQIMAVFVLVPIVAPIIGTGLIAVLPWRALFWFSVLWGLAIAAWSTRLTETLDRAHVRPLHPRQVARTYAEVARTRVTMGYSIAAVFLQGMFTLYLASIELIIGEIYGRPGQFPYVFGAVAVLFGLSALLNSRLVGRFGIDGMVRIAMVALLTCAPVLLIVAVVGSGRPPFWAFIGLVGLTLATSMLLMPNLNSAAMMPVGHIAGAASAFSSALRIGVGSAIAAVATPFVKDSVTPFAVFVMVMSVACVITIRLVQRRVLPAG